MTEEVGEGHVQTIINNIITHVKPKEDNILKMKVREIE
jgi:hypothetical protein